MDAPAAERNGRNTKSCYRLPVKSKSSRKKSKRSFAEFLSRPLLVVRGLVANPLLLWLLGLLCLAGLVAYPLSTGFTRLAEVILVCILAAGLLALCWKRPYLRWSLVAFYFVCAVFASMPGHTDYDRVALRQETARALQRYEGSRYYWGGEGFLGIDCSGLVRRGIIDGLFLHGMRHLNPWMVRRAAFIWWNDYSALELGSGAKGRTRLLKEAKTIKGMDESRMDPGDFAITQGGVHALAFLGDHLWIEADPGMGKVIKVNARATDNPWFQQPVGIHRWRLLDLERHVGRQP